MSLARPKVVQAQAMYYLHLNLINASAKKNLRPETFYNMCTHMAEGKCVALEVKCKDPNLNVVCEFRKFCGPRDPDVCRQLYPDSIRALFGKTEVHNAVHCTDLPEDGEREVEYFFKLIANESK